VPGRGADETFRLGERLLHSEAVKIERRNDAEKASQQMAHGAAIIAPKATSQKNRRDTNLRG
jgi:hypothetical protein